MRTNLKVGLTCFVSVAGAVLLLTAIFVIYQFEGDGLMKYRKLEPEQMDEERAKLENRPRYKLGERGDETVRFHFNLDLVNDGETLFVIHSNRMNATIYIGPYKRSLSLEIDTRLAEDDGYDNLVFYLLQIEQKQLCIWSNERGYPYWCPSAEISIEFLQKGVFDIDGLYKEHNVTIR